MECGVFEMHEDCSEQVAQPPPAAGVRSVVAKSAVAMRHSSPRFMPRKRTLMVRLCPLVSFGGSFDHSAINDKQGGALYPSENSVGTHLVCAPLFV